jgi:hypothetical protein
MFIHIRFLLSFILFFISFVSHSAFIEYVCEVEIFYTKGIVKGYIIDYSNSQLNVFDSIVTSEESKYLFRSNQSIKSNQALDTLDVYKEIYRIDSLDANLLFKDKLVRIPTTEIKSIKVISSIETSAYQHALITATSKDKNWLTQKYLSKEVVVYNFNDWVTIYFFEEISKKGKLKAEQESLRLKYHNRELPEEEQIKWDQKVNQYLKILEGKKVIVVRAFSD